MRNIALLSLAAMLLTATTPAQGDEGVRERNRAWLTASFGDRPLVGPAALHVSGLVQEVTIGEAIEMTLDRFGAVDAAGLAATATNGEFPALLDVWLYEVGVGGCPEPVASRLVPVGATLVTGDQVWLYGGPSFVQGFAQSDLSTAGFGQAIEWAWKTAWLYHEPVLYGGHSDFFCFEFEDLAVNFPYLDGMADSVRTD